MSLKAQGKSDTVQNKITTLGEKISGLEERLTTTEGDLAKLTKIKLSGYIQAQWQKFENPSVYPGNYFSVRRARVKVVYEPVTGVAFVLQPDFQPGALAIKDAYAQANEPWLKTFSLWAGQFNRPNYEVEYSSSNREVAERSLVIRTLYPGERAIGAKLEVAPPSIPLKVQLALFNGNDALIFNDPSSTNINPTNKDYDNGKDFMGRATYGFKFGNFGGLTIGANYYYGVMKASSTMTLASDYTLKDNVVKIGSNLNRSWFGVEMQLFLDVLGGMVLKGEYLNGTNSNTGIYGSVKTTDITGYSDVNDTIRISQLTTNLVVNRPNIIKNFQGYYIYLVKNIGKKHQVAVRYDYYDPNTKLKGSDIGSLASDGKTPVYGYDGKIATTYSTKTGSPAASGTKTVITTETTKTVTSNTLVSDVSDIAYGTVSLAYSYFFSDNIKLMIDYDIVLNEKVGEHLDPKTNQNVGNVMKTYTVNNIGGNLDYSKVFPQNQLTVRLQVKF